MEKVKYVANRNLAESAYIGDDINDLPSMKLIKEAGGMIGCPDAVDEVKKLRILWQNIMEEMELLGIL